MTIKTVSIDAIQLDGFKIETRSRQHVALVDQPIAGGGTDSGPDSSGILVCVTGQLYCDHRPHHRQTTPPARAQYRSPRGR